MDNQIAKTWECQWCKHLYTEDELQGLGLRNPYQMLIDVADACDIGRPDAQKFLTCVDPEPCRARMVSRMDAPVPVEVSVHCHGLSRKPGDLVWVKMPDGLTQYEVKEVRRNLNRVFPDGHYFLTGEGFHLSTQCIDTVIDAWRVVFPTNSKEALAALFKQILPEGTRVVRLLVETDKEGGRCEYEWLAFSDVEKPNHSVRFPDKV